MRLLRGDEQPRVDRDLIDLARKAGSGCCAGCEASSKLQCCSGEACDAMLGERLHDILTLHPPLRPAGWVISSARASMATAGGLPADLARRRTASRGYCITSWYRCRLRAYAAVSLM
ncbi:unnamed protein product [Phytophthora lilii]|uniref:Unnamed protein product n=1 Tax=Phytophthora lilii TaxID=2077276 RepID=A0A9W7CLY1_9STRA|nr:unnamed protein product [Phytophthora lilii]